MASDTKVKDKGEDVAQTVALISEDGQTQRIVPDAIKNYAILRQAATQGTRLAAIKGSVLARVVEFLARAHGEKPLKPIPKPLPSTDMKQVTNAWAAEWIDALDVPMLVEVGNAAANLQVTPLAELSGAKLASLIKGRTHDEIRSIFREVTPPLPVSGVCPECNT